MKAKSAVGFGVMVLFMALLLMNFGSQVGGYATFDAVAEGQKAHIIGTWAKEHPTTYDKQANVFTFHMRDETGSLRRVIYNNPKPANFEDAIELVVEGREKNGAFIADYILVKCPSKYNETRGLEDTARFSIEPPFNINPTGPFMCMGEECVRMDSAGTYEITHPADP